MLSISFISLFVIEYRTYCFFLSLCLASGGAHTSYSASARLSRSRSSVILLYLCSFFILFFLFFIICIRCLNSRLLHPSVPKFYTSRYPRVPFPNKQPYVQSLRLPKCCLSFIHLWKLPPKELMWGNHKDMDSSDSSCNNRKGRLGNA